MGSKALLKYTKIGLPLDGSLVAEEAVPVATRLAHQLGAELLLMRVIEPPPSEKNLLNWESEAASPARLYLQNLSHALISGPSQELRLRPDQFETRVIWGKPADEVLRLAVAEKVDLLIMTTHGGGGIFHALMGSMTAAIFEHSRLPLLVLRSRHPDQKLPQIGHSGPLLVTLDGTLKAETILGPTIELARRLELPITLLRVVSPFIPVDALSTWYLRNLDKEPGKMNKAAFAFLLSQAQQYLEVIQSKLCKQGVACNCVVRVGDTAHEIRKYACESQATVLAMAAHSRGRFGQGWLGSVIGEVMQHADRPLLLVNSANQVINPVAVREATSVS